LAKYRAHIVVIPQQKQQQRNSLTDTGHESWHIISVENTAQNQHGNVL